MKKLYFISAILLIGLCSALFFSENNETQSIQELREQHLDFVNNSPYAKTVNLPKADRKALGLPPNAYNEMLWQMTLDPSTGRPMPERINDLQLALKKERASSQNRGVGGDANNPWVERGPSHANLIDLVFGSLGPTGGRTRGIMFDPNDTNNEKVFAGGVSGGLWVNNDITNQSSGWSLVAGLPSNIRVKNIIYDPNNTNTFYIGAGESYTAGDAIGNGVWKSTDAGATWTNVLGGYTGTSINGPGGYPQIIDGIFYINDIVARDVGATTELYAAVAHAYFPDGASSAQGQWHGYFQHGIYKSTNNGSSWTNISVSGGAIDAAGVASNPNDLEIDISNNLWVATTRNNQQASGSGGKIWRSTNGTSFTLMHTLSTTDRTEIEVSSSSADELWVLSRNVGTGLPELWYTSNAFTGISALTLPVDADGATIPANDFTRGQSWYDLEIEADSNGNLYVGGIDLFRSTDNGSTWSQISEWYNIGSLVASHIHADQQAIVFRPGDDNQAVFGTDGGIYYSSSLSGAVGNASGIEHRNLDYATIQYYYGALDELDGADGDDFMGGSQDNGTSHKIDAAAGINIFDETFGGDGAFTEIDAASGYAIQSYFGNDHNYVPYPSLDISSDYQISSGTGGSFINQAELDKNLDILYVNSTTGSTYRIERISNFQSGAGSVVRTQLTDAALDHSPTAFKVSPYTAASTTLMVGLLNGKLLRVTNADGSPTFTDITGSSFLGTISDIEFGQNESQIFVTMWNYGVTSVWYTSDGGTNWVSKEGDLPDMPVRCILQNPLVPEQLIIGTSLGVWATEDHTMASPTWVQAYNGMSDVPVTDLDTRSSDNLILASTYGRGMFTSQFTTDPSLTIEETDLTSTGIKIFPTVNDGRINLKSETNLGEVDVYVFSVTGKEVIHTQVNLNSLAKAIELNVESGVYFVRLSAQNLNLTKKVIVK